MYTIEEIEEILKEKFTISDEPCDRTYIFPDGKFLHIPIFNSNHASIEYFLKEKGIIPEDEKPSGSCKFIEDLGCIRGNLRKEGFVGLSIKPPTSQQYESLKTFIDKYQHSCGYMYGDFFLIEPQPKFEFHRIDTHELNSDMLVKIIKRYYTSGVILEEKEEE